MARLGYFVKSAAANLFAARHRCPNCGGKGVHVMRKYVVTALLRCETCDLLFRTPTDTPQEAEAFYNDDYEQGKTTALPSLAELEQMKADNFSTMENNYGAFAALIKQLGVPDGARVFDYGCSWGYGSYMFRQAGFAVKSFEISRPRRSYGVANLGIDLVEDFDSFAAANPASCDVFFSSHVLEHVPSPSRIIATGLSLLKPGGLFVSLFPNGSAPFRARSPQAWRQLWGEVHPNFLDDRYLEATFCALPCVIGSTPLPVTPEITAHLARGESGVLRANDLDGHELLVIARKPA